MATKRQNIVPAKPPELRRTPSLPRVTDLPESERETFERLYELKMRPTAGVGFAQYLSGKMHPMFAVLLNSPPMAQIHEEANQYWRPKDRQPAYQLIDLEWIVQVVSRELHDNRLVGHHSEIALRNGFKPEWLKAIRQDRYDLLPPEEQERVQFIQRVVRGEVTDESWSRWMQRFGLRAAIDLVGFTTWIIMIFRLQQAFDIWYDHFAPDGTFLDATTDEEIDALIDGVITRTVKVP